MDARNKQQKTAKSSSLGDTGILVLSRLSRRVGHAAARQYAVYVHDDEESPHVHVTVHDDRQLAFAEAALAPQKEKQGDCQVAIAVSEHEAPPEGAGGVGAGQEGAGGGVGGGFEPPPPQTPQLSGQDCVIPLFEHMFFCGAIGQVTITPPLVHPVDAESSHLHPAAMPFIAPAGGTQPPWVKPV